MNKMITETIKAENKVLPILFNTEMVQAILDGRKTVTRRVIKPQQLIGILPDKCKNGSPKEFLKEKKQMFKPYCDMTDAELIMASYNPPYQPGDILYVRETWHKYKKRVGKGEGCHIAEFYGYKASIANSEDANEPWRPSIHMPKEAARIWLKVKDVRVEKLQEITEEQAKAEGIRGYSKDGSLYKYAVTDDWWIDYHNKHRKSFLGTWWQDMPRTASEAFSYLWNSTIKKSELDRYGWDASPWVWVIEFERLERQEQ